MDNLHYLQADPEESKQRSDDKKEEDKPKEEPSNNFDFNIENSEEVMV